VNTDVVQRTEKGGGFSEDLEEEAVTALFTWKHDKTKKHRYEYAQKKTQY
jgi:hypothetical protein